MILFQFDFYCITFFPFEGNAPGAVDMDTVTLGVSLETVKVKPRHIQISQQLSLIQSIQASQCTELLILPYFTGVTLFKQLGKPLMFEAFYHVLNCSIL
jgi:hypothetical protein